MTCLFCGSGNLEGENSPLKQINSQLAEYMCQILGIPSEGSFYHTAFCQFNYCDVCESRIYKSQALLQKLEEIQKEIAETKNEFEEVLKETYLSRLNQERNKNDNDVDQINVPEDDASIIEFRHALVSELHLNVPIKSEIDHHYSTSRSFHGNYCKLEVTREESDHDYEYYHDDEGSHWEEDVSHEIIEEQGQQQKGQTLLHVPSSTRPKKNSKRKTTLQKSKIKYSTPVNSSDIKLKDLRVCLERLSPAEISLSATSSSSPRKSSPFNLRGRIKCSHRNCFRFFANEFLVQKHIKYHHSGKKGKKIPKTETKFFKSVGDSEVLVVSDSDDNGEDHDYANDGDHLYEPISKHPSRPFRCTVKKCRSAFASEYVRDVHVKSAHQEETIKLLRFVCTEKDCTESFREHRALQAHTKKVHLGYKNPHECELCEPTEKVGFKSRTLLLNHLRKVHPDRPKVYACKSCFKEFQDLGSLKMHINIDHPEMAKKRKSICALNNSTNANIKSHDATATSITTTEIISATVLIPGDSIQVGGEEVAVANFDESIRENTVMRLPKYPCTVEGCPRAFASSSIRRRHVLQFHEGKSLKTFKCSEEGCDDMFRDKVSLQAHINRIHLGSATPYECVKCDFKCAVRSELRAHKIEYPDHEEKRGRKSQSLFTEDQQNYICHHCGNVYNNRESFRHHLRVHGPKKHVCPYTECTKAFIKRGDLKNHLITHTKEKTVICFQCGKGLRDKQGLNHHLKICQVKDFKSEFKCDKCNRSYKYHSTFEAHLKEHDGTIEHPFKCDFPECNYTCKFNSMLVLHKQRHALTKDYECNICPSKFKYKQHLIRHRDLKHFGTRGFRCNLCDYVGNSKTSLQVHLYSHTGEKPYSCEICPKQFTSRAHLIRHSRLHAAGGKMKMNKKMKNSGDADNNKLSKKVNGDELGSRKTKRIIVGKTTGSSEMESFVYMDAEEGEYEEGEEENEQMQQNVVQVQHHQGETVLAFVASEVELI